MKSPCTRHGITVQERADGDFDKGGGNGDGERGCYKEWDEKGPQFIAYVIVNVLGGGLVGIYYII